mgnify:CR=1 FL=1
MKVILASNNANKLREMQQILSPLGWEILRQRDVGLHLEPDENGVRIAELDEISYRELLWDHKPLTDFWRVGTGYRRKLEAAGMFTMGDVARCSIGSTL